jgi:hypothetical protein
MGAVYGITGSLALAANTANQLVCAVVSAGSTSDAIITWLDCTMDAATPAQGVKIELVRYTAGPPTGTTYTPNRLSAASQAVAASMIAWVPPVTPGANTGPVPVKTWYLPPTGGVLIQWPLARRTTWSPGPTCGPGCARRLPRACPRTWPST